MPRRYPQQEFITSGKLIGRLTHSLARVKDWSMEATMSYIGYQTRRSSDMVYRWQQGRLLPRAEAVEVLVRIGYSEAELPREWCEDFLRATHYTEMTNLLNKLCGPKNLRTVLCQLPRLEHARLIGRQEEINHLQELLLPHKAAHLITVDGIGGVGKTALTLDVAHQIWHASTGETVMPHLPTFDVIAFVSAKQQYLTAGGLLPRTQTHSTLRKIFQEVTLILGRDDIRLTPFEEQADLVREAFGRQRTLLIVDNLETMEDKQGILSFLYELTSTVKVVLTTRERAIYTPIRLEQLAEDAAIELIEQQAEEKQVSLSQREVQMLYKRIGGIPAALVYAVGQRAAGYSMESILRMVPSAEGDVARFCFQGSVDPLRGKKAHEVLMAFALFSRMPSRAAVTYVAGLETDPIEAEEALSQLQRLSLIRELDDRFRMLPLTREYALAELRAHPDFEKKAHERWVTWYLRFAQNYGGHDMEDWYKRFDPLNEEWENLQALFDWCAVHDRYDVLKVFWCAEEPGSVIDFTALYGHWDNRLDWLNWLIDAAEGREDWLTWLDATASKAITLALMTRHTEAEKCFEEGEEYLSYAQPHIKVHWLINKVYPSVFKIGPKNREKINTQEYFDKARALLDQARDIAQHVPDAQLRTRFTLNINYNYASAFYWRGETAIAKETFQRVMEEANTFGWQWLANGAQNYLGDIARNEGDYDTAERLLELGLRIAERNNEKRRAAKYKSSLAYLRQKQGRRDEALEWAKMAHSDFSRIKVLGVDLEIKRMENLINTLEPNRSH